MSNFTPGLTPIRLGGTGRLDGTTAFGQLSIVYFGDSLVANEWANFTNVSNINNWGPFSRANIKLGNPFYVLANAGISGNTTTQMLARISTDVLSFKPKYVYFHGGVNDEPAGKIPATTISNITQICQKCVSNGITVLLSTITPTSAPSTNQVNYYNTVNSFMRSYSQTNSGIILLDFAKYLLDTSSMANTTGFIVQSGVTYDGLHYNGVGAGILGEFCIYNTLKTYIAQGTSFFACNALSNTSGDLSVYTSNPLMIQGAGGSFGAGASGTAPEGWNIARSAGSITAVSSIVPRNTIYNDGIPGSLLKLVISGSAATTEQIIVKQDISVASRPYTANQSWTMEAEVYATASSGTIYQFEIGHQLFGASGSANANTSDTGTVGTMGSTQFNGIIRTRPIIVPSGASSWLHKATIATSIGANVTVYLSYMGTRLS